MDEIKTPAELPRESAPKETAVERSREQLKDASSAGPASGATAADPAKEGSQRIKTRTGSGYLKQLYSTARTTAGSQHTNLRSTTFLVNFIPTEAVDASELQVRVHFDDQEIAALSHSIREHGVLQPILVVQDGDRYKVIAGERRLRAAKLAGIERIPARVLSTNDKATHEIALRENLDRVDLHPLEEGEGYVSLLEAQAYTSHDSISKAFGKPKSRITECIGFTRLPTATKTELLSHGLRNRALLRQLLLTAPEKHSEMIREAAGREETLGDLAVESTEVAAPAVPKTAQKREAKPFALKYDEKSLSVPGFKWKAGEGTEKLQCYVEAIRKLMEQLEERLTRP